MLNTAGGVRHSVSVSQQQMEVGLVWLHMHRCWLVHVTDKIHAEGLGEPMQLLVSGKIKHGEQFTA